MSEANKGALLAKKNGGNYDPPVIYQLSHFYYKKDVNLLFFAFFVLTMAKRVYIFNTNPLKKEKKTWEDLENQ